jgi:hypothetical protein
MFKNKYKKTAPHRPKVDSEGLTGRHIYFFGIFSFCPA